MSFLRFGFFFFCFVSLSFLTVVPRSWFVSFVKTRAMLVEVAFMLRFMVAVLTVVPGHVFVVDSCAMLLESAFMLRFVVAVLTAMPGHAFFFVDEFVVLAARCLLRLPFCFAL